MCNHINGIVGIYEHHFSNWTFVIVECFKTLQCFYLTPMFHTNKYWTRGKVELIVFVSPLNHLTIWHISLSLCLSLYNICKYHISLSNLLLGTDFHLLFDKNPPGKSDVELIRVWLDCHNRILTYFQATSSRNFRLRDHHHMIALVLYLFISSLGIWHTSRRRLWQIE